MGVARHGEEKMASGHVGGGSAFNGRGEKGREQVGKGHGQAAGLLRASMDVGLCWGARLEGALDWR